MKESQRQAAVLDLLGQVGLERPPKSLDELFSGAVLHDFFGKMLKQDTQLLINFRPLPQIDQDVSYQQQKLTSLTHLFKQVRQLAEEHKHATRQLNLKRIAYDDDEDELFELIRFIVETLIQDTIVIETIKQCSPQTQMFFMTILQHHAKSDKKHSQTEQLLTTIEQLELSIQEKDASIKNLNGRLLLLSEQNDTLRHESSIYKHEVDELRKKMGEYEELEHVFDNKDNQLRQLNDQVQELRLALQKEKMNAKDRIEEMQAKLATAKQQLSRYEDNHEVEKLRKQLKDSQHNVEELTSKMNQDKSVTKNLKDHCLRLQEKQKELLNEKMEMVLMASEKQQRLNRLTSKLEECQHRLRKQLEEKEQFTRSMKDSNREALGVELNYQFKTIAETSVDYCTNVDCQRAKEDSKTYYSRNLELTEKLQRLTAMPSSNGSGDDYSAKLSGLTAENGKLREKLASLTNNAAGFYEEAMVKLKKKNGILKKRLQEQEEKRGRQAVTMSSVILELQQIIQDNIPNSRIVELLRKLK